MEYPIYFIYLLLIFFANRYYKYRAETCVFGSSICKIESVFTEDNIVSSRCKRKQSYKALRTHAPILLLGPTLLYLEVLGFHSLHG